MMTIYTIGYEGIDIGDFLLLLQRNNIQTLLDIRQLPLSRKRGFSKHALAHYLGLHHIAYMHLPAFGCPKPIRNQYKTDKNWLSYTQAFTDYLQTRHIQLSELADFARSSHCALLCFEANYHLCHRSLVAAELNTKHGLSIHHIEVEKINPSAAQHPLF